MVDGGRQVVADLRDGCACGSAASCTRDPVTSVRRYCISPVSAYVAPGGANPLRIRWDRARRLRSLPCCCCSTSTGRSSAARAYARLCEGSLADTVLPGVRDGLRAFDDAGHRLALVTGNLEPIARLKLGRAGLGDWLDGVPGGFASDHELRARLPGIARERAGNVPPEGAVVVGDTPLDVACAQADGVRCIAVTTGWFSA